MTLWVGVWPHGHNLNKLGRGLLDDATYQYQGALPSGFRQEDFFVSLYKPMKKTCDPPPPGWGHF